MATVPVHPRLPLTLDPRTGTFVSVPQDSLIEVRQCAKAILRTRPGQRIEDPRLGCRDPRFGTDVDVDAIAAALDEFEPRAEWELVADPIDPSGTVGVRVTAVNA